MTFRQFKIDLWNLMMEAACAQVKHEGEEEIDKLRRQLLEEYPEHWDALRAEEDDKKKQVTKVPLQFQIALGFATDCFDSEDLEPVPGNDGRLPDKPTLH
tara:strand:- start:888 stop:1187 length:300 start_codon:yes stop_codon:yes gene_type:complete